MLRAAIDLANREGLESLSMRKLGQELGVEAMSLYNHVANKNDILAGMVELVTAEIEAPEPSGDWKAALRAGAISAHEVLLRHRWAAALVMRVAELSPARLRWSEALLRTCREAGFSPYLTHHAYHALESHITGFTLWAVSLPFETRAELLDLATEVLRTFPAADYPYTLEHIQQHIGEPDPDEPSTFEFGLDLILDGLERLRDAPPYAWRG